MLDPNFQQDVSEFHEAAGQPPGQAPRLLEGRVPFDKIIEHLSAAYVQTKLTSQSDGEMALRLGLILEEVGELVEALRDGDLVAQFDALLDILYVVVGTGVAQGLPLTLGWCEVHRTNMNKVRSGRISDPSGKIMKPEGWTGPEAKLKELIERMRIRSEETAYEAVAYGSEVVFDVEVLPPEVTPEESPNGNEEDPNDGGAAGRADGAAGGGGLYGKW